MDEGMLLRYKQSMQRALGRKDRLFVTVGNSTDCTAWVAETDGATERDGAKLGLNFSSKCAYWKLRTTQCAATSLTNLSARRWGQTLIS